MAEIDLIPASYRTLLQLRSWGVRTVAMIGGALVLTVAGFASFSYINKEVDVEVRALQAKKEITERQREQLKQLNTEKSVYANRLTLLNELRSGVQMDGLFRTIDRALVDSGVWFKDWEFTRANAIVKNREDTVNTGYFIIVKSADEKEADETWRIDTHMNIKGQAEDHSALSRFVRRLFEEPDIQDVRILNTSRSPRRKVVEFDLAIIMKNKGNRS